MKRILSKLKISPSLDLSSNIFHGCLLSFFSNFRDKYCYSLLLIVVMMFSPTTAKADLTKDVEPTSTVTCQPNSSTPFTTSFTVGKGSGCSNLSSAGIVTFIWEYFNGSGWVTVSNNTPAGFTYSNISGRTGSGSNAQITNTLTVTLSSSATIGVFSYRCRANQPTGCTNFITSNTITVTVYAKPVPTFTTEPGASACVNSSVTYTTQAGQSGYTWVIPGVSGTDYTITAGSTSTNTVTLTWLTAGSKTVTINYTNSNGCTPASPTSSTTTTVNGVPLPSFTSQPSGTVCSSTDVTYTTQAGQSNYIWSVPGVSGIDYAITAGGIGIGSNTVTLQWLTPGSKIITINYNNAAGCSAATGTSSNAVTVTARPVPSFTVSPSSNICSGTDVTYTTQSVQTNYVWTVPGVLNTDYTITSGSIGTGSNTVTLQWLTAGNKNVTVNYTSSLCTGLSEASSTSTVTLRPVPTFTSSPGANTCSNTDITYTTQAGQSNYVWTVDGTAGIDYNITGGSVGFGSNTVTMQWLTTGSSRTVTVNYNNGGGCNALTAASSITFINASPDVNNFSINAADGCEGIGSIVTVNSSTIANGTYTVTYDLSGANTATGYTATMIFSGGTGIFTAAALNQGATNITVTQVGDIGCGTSVSSGNTANFTINPLPSLSPITGASTVCIGNTITLSNATSGGSWASADILIATVNGSGVVSGVLTGAVDITYTTAPVNGCTNSTIKNIIVNALPPSTPITGTTTLCINSNTTLANSNSGGSWTSSNSPVATINISGVVSASMAGTTIITYIFPANANGCTDSVFTTVTVDPAATANAGSSITVCQSASPSPITLSGSSVGGAAATGAWSIVSGGGTLSSTLQTANPASITYSPAANFSGTVTLLLTTNAPGSCPAVTSTKTITVSQLPTVSAGPSVTVCQSASPSAITLSGASVSGGATTGAWSIISGGGSLSNTSQTATPATITYTPAANFTGTVTLRLTTNFPGGCTAATADRTINVTAAPIANAGTAIQTCSDVTQTPSGAAAVNITAGSSASNQASVLWSSSGTGTFTNPTSLTTATYTPSAADKTAGSVTLTLTALGNSPCGNTTSSKTFTITPAINENDANNWAQAPNCNGLGVQFSLPAAPGGGNGTFTYQWMQKNNCGTAGASTPVPGATGMSFVPLADNCYWLQISSGGCTLPQNLVSTTTRQRPSPDTGALANINFGVGGSNPKICIGSSTTLTAQSSVSYTYTWSPSTGLSTTTGASVIANPASTTIYTITAVATDGTGCTKTAKDTVTVSPVTVAGSVPASAVACNSGSASINITGNTGSVTRWESSTDGGSTWAPISNTSTTLNYTIAATTTLYRALVQSGACASVYTNATQTGLHNVWQGKTSTDWQTATNWSDQALPTLSCPTVTIPAATPFSPILNSGVVTINSLVINSSALLTIANNANMQIAGTITNNGSFDVTDGSLEFNGTSAQNVSGNAFVSNTVRNIILSNTNGLIVNNSAGNLLNIKEAFTFGNVNNTSLTTNDNLVLLSSATGTARIADITNNNANNGNSISGKVTIQRYIPGRRAWRLLSAPVTTASLVKISDSWQEAAPRVTNPAVINATNNPDPGYGTHVTYGNPATNGFDQGINGNPSIIYLTATGWNGIPTATNNGSTLNSGYITDQPGYMLFVRGDRSTQLSQATYAATTPTVLRMKGDINSGLLNISLSPGMLFGGSHFRVVGNPYPSAVNFHKIFLNAANSAAGFSDAYYFWDPSVTGTNGVGGWVAMSYNNISGVYDRTVLTGGSSTINNSGDIQSGAAFVIDYNGAATNMRMEEPNKVSGSNNSQFRPMYQPNQVRISLLAKNPDSSISVNDGVLVTFHESFNNAVDRSDMRKLLNFAENIAVVKDSIALVLERRKTFDKTDTIQLQLSKMRPKNYQLQVELDNLSTTEGTVAVLEDKVAVKQEVITAKATNLYDFMVNADNILSTNDRFRILFKQMVNFDRINGYLQNRDVLIDWQLASEFNVGHFEIERSEDGIHFSLIAVVNSGGNTEKAVRYTATDVNPINGNYFYRVKTVGKNGAVVYSNLINIKVVNRMEGFYVFPNPVKGPSLQLQINSIDPGTYQATLLNMDGKQMLTAVIYYNGGIHTSKISLPAHTSPGTYLLKITGADGNTTSLKVLVDR